MNINKIAKVIETAKMLYHERKDNVADALLDAFVEEMEMDNGKVDRIIAHYDDPEYKEVTADGE